MDGTDPPACAHHAGARRPGKFTPETCKRIVDMLRAGSYPKVAANAAGVSERTFYYWIERAQTDDDYREFAEAVDRALSEGEARAVAVIAAASTESWQAAAWMLERRYPDRWARPSQRDKDEKAPAVDPADPFNEVDELAAYRRRHGA